jgi:hypothetical protein
MAQLISGAGAWNTCNLRLALSQENEKHCIISLLIEVIDHMLKLSLIYPEQRNWRWEEY